VKAFEAMQVEMDAINKHLKSLTTENQELTTKLDALTKENTAARDRNIELLTRYDMLGKELEKKTAEMNKLSKDGKDSRSKKNNEKHEKEKNSLQTKIDKLELENKLLKNSLANTLDEQKRLSESLKNLVDGKKVQRKNSGKSRKDIVSEEYEIRTEISGLTTTKPDLIRDSTEVKDEYMIVEQRKYRTELSTVENSGSEADIKDLVADLLKGQMNLKGYCHEISKVVKDKSSHNSKDEADGKGINEAKVSLDTTKAELEKTAELKKDLESSLQKKEEELSKSGEENAKLESELANIKEKCEKLQAVFRKLILVMNDKKAGEKKSGEEGEGPTSIIDQIKGIKKKYTTLITEKENLESKVSELQKEIDEYKARAKQVEERTKDSKKKQEKSGNKSSSEDKEKILNELLLSTARNKTRLLEKLQEIFDEFSKVKSKLDKELDSQGKGSNLEKINQEFSESIMHTERFIQSVAHDRPVTVVADSADEKDPNLELAKENEELIGRISAVQSSRRRESKNYKDELTKIEKNKVEAVKAEETKWKDEMEKMKAEFEQKIKEKEQAATEVKNSLKQDVSQLKLDIRRISDEHEVAQRTARNEARLAAEKLEEKIKLLKAEMDKKLFEKDSNIVQVKRKADSDVKENAQMAEREISQVRANWADAERKLRVASEQKTDAVRELERVKQDRSEEGGRSARDLQKLKVALENVQKQATEREDGFKKERDRLQRTIANLEGQVRNAEVNGLERTQTKISELQRSLDELSKQKQQLETARRNSEQNLVAENERLRFETSRLQRELWELNQQRRTNGGNDIQRRPDPNIPSGERVKVMGTVRQAPIEKSRMVTPVESAPGPFPGGPGLYPSDPQRRTVKVREGQATSVHVTRVQDQVVRRSSDQRDPISDELNDSPNTVILARPMQARTQAHPPPQKQAAPPPQKPQPEWEARQDNTWPMRKDPSRYPSNNTRYKDPPARAQPSSPRTGYYKEDSRQRPGYPNSKPITRQTQGSLGAEVTLPDNRRAVEVKKLPVKEKPRSTKSRHERRPSVGSDDVFVPNSFVANPSLTSHGSKTGDFWRSRSLEDLLISDDRPMKQSEHVVRAHNQKLPKSFSGPRRGDPRLAAAKAAQQGKGPGNQAGGKKVAPLKGMEYVLFQSQM
jgi:predicted  nucleic acid-binding Zn-ribbon protein